MEESCLLCLEIRRNEGLADGIKADSNSWRELHIKEIIEKHFWPLNDVPLSYTWLCLRCWQEVRDFHEFYMRIEKAHQTASKIKATKQDLPNFGYLEPEILITEPMSNQDKITIKSELPVDGPNLNYEPLKQLPTNPKLNDPLNKSEPEDSTQFNDSNSNSDSDVDDIEKDSDYNMNDTAPIKKPRTCIKRGKHKDNDLFITKYFKEILCDLCQVKFEDFPGLQKHFMDAHKQIGYILCCNRKFYRRYSLVDHIHTHLNPDHFKCDQCGKVLSDRVTLKSHILSVHQSDGPKLKHCCDICGKSFIKPYALRKHKLTHLPDEEKKFPCPDCGKHYPSSSSLKLHREVIHLKKHAKICHICGLILRTSTEHKAHMNKHEGIRTYWNCDICGLRVSGERVLKLHKESQHPVGGKQEHKCSLCPQVSPTLRALKKHFHSMHVKGYDYKCMLCEKAFKRSEALKEHMASHTGTALYTCPWCPKTFNSNSNMYAHRKKMHPKESEEAKLKKYASINGGNLPI